MPSEPLISVDEYLHTLYRPDCDFVDGALVQRNVRLLDHQRLTGAVLFYYHDRRLKWGSRSFHRCASEFPLPAIGLPMRACF
jgi:hypothetical protein